MKNTFTLLFCIGGLAIALGVTNPGIKSYRAFAIESLTDYTKSNLCLDQALGKFLQQQCAELVDAATPQMGQLIDGATERQNYLLFSIYKTNLEVSPLVPSFRFESIGLFNTFYLYRHERR